MNNKLISIQSELKTAKSQYNSFGKYYYRNCEDILEAVKPLLKANNLVLTLSDEVDQIGNRYYVKAIAKITDGTKEVIVTAYARESESKKGMDDSQITGAASSYARKYALNGLFCIDDTKDDDFNNNGKKDTQKPEPTQAKEEKATPNTKGAGFITSVQIAKIKNLGADIDKWLSLYDVKDISELKTTDALYIISQEQ